MHRAAGCAVGAAHAGGPAGRPRPVGVLAAHQRRLGRQGPPLVWVEPGGAQRRWRVGWVGRWLLVRRSLHRRLTSYVCAGPARLPLVTLVGSPGPAGEWRRRLQAGKGLCGLWMSTRSAAGACWYRWVTLAMLAYAFLVVAADIEHTRHPAPQGRSN
jgi:hypothetical protein